MKKNSITEYSDSDARVDKATGTSPSFTRNDKSRNNPRSLCTLKPPY